MRPRQWHNELGSTEDRKRPPVFGLLGYLLLICAYLIAWIALISYSVMGWQHSLAGLLIAVGMSFIGVVCFSSWLDGGSE